MKTDPFQAKRYIMDIDRKMTASQGRLLDILARISACLLSGNTRFPASYYLDLKREYAAELETLAGLKRLKAQAGATENDNGSDGPIHPTDPRFVSTQ
jgi:hypothetical protein